MDTIILYFVMLLAAVNFVVCENKTEGNRDVVIRSDLSSFLVDKVQARGIKKYIPLIASIVHAIVTKFIVVKIVVGGILVALYFKFFKVLDWLKWWLLKEYEEKKKYTLHHVHDHDWHDHDRNCQYGHYRQDHDVDVPYYHHEDRSGYLRLPIQASHIRPTQGARLITRLQRRARLDFN